MIDILVLYQKSAGRKSKLPIAC